MTTGHSNLRGCKNLCLTLLHPDREAPIKTRKRTFSEANSSNATATRRSPCSAAAPQSLRKNGYFQALIPNSTADTLAVAVKAFQAQLEVLSKQPPQSRHAGFTQLARKQRLEFCAGDHALGQLGLLQGLAITVLEAIQYTLPKDTIANRGTPACEAHKDKGLLTLIYSDTERGLQVQELDGTWRHLLLSQGHIAVLAGYTLERAACGLIPAAKHRVLVGAPGGCPTPRTALVYKLRAPETAVVNMYSSLSQHAIIPRYRTPIGVCELMHHFDATHVSVNTVPPLAPSIEEQPTASQTQKGKTESCAHPASPDATAYVTRSGPGVPVKLIVKTQDGAEIHFTVSVDTPLEQIFDAVCSMKNMNRSEARFRFEGDHIKPLCTPKLLEMEDGDVIDMLVSLVGD